MKIKHQVLVAAILLTALFAWAFFQLVLPWLQRTTSDPQLESRAPAHVSVIDASGSGVAPARAQAGAAAEHHRQGDDRARHG